MKAWYVATTYINQELLAERELRKQGFFPFNPRTRSVVVERNRAITKLEQYIRGYIFVRFDFERDRWWPINNTRGVRHLITNTPLRPTPIRTEIMEPLLALSVDGYIDAPEADMALFEALPVGSKVKLKAGPFKDFEGRVTLSSLQRVTVMLSMFGRTSPVAMAARSVELVS